MNTANINISILFSRPRLVVDMVADKARRDRLNRQDLFSTRQAAAEVACNNNPSTNIRAR